MNLTNQYMNYRLKTILFIMFSLGVLSSCVSIKEYQKVYLNDEDMSLSQRKIESFEINFESYREAAVGANGGKVGGGCGCN
jgi:hypothetical protein